ncbi:MAG: saccharopine dehydrogenase NADP-binding domain-containing protein, partial [Dehalococcoidia bacterium]|nr:saccharopine dehydrogenase NADP-binding domain-containing protein [Dehalococcoidia bacterium]
MKVLIVGAGCQGAPCASILARDKDISEIVLGDVDIDLANKVKNKINSKKITVVKLDAGRIEDIEGAAKGVDVIINLVVPQFNANIMKAALRSGTQYVDAALD